MNLTPVEIAWLAGIIEGEGCFHFTPARKVGGGRWNARATIAVTLGTTDKDIAERVAGMIGGNVTPRKVLDGRKPFWTTQVGGQKAEDVMRAIRPFTSHRRSARIDELLSKEELSHR